MYLTLFGPPSQPHRFFGYYSQRKYFHGNRRIEDRLEWDDMSAIEPESLSEYPKRVILAPPELLNWN